MAAHFFYNWKKIVEGPILQKIDIHNDGLFNITTSVAALICERIWKIGREWLRNWINN